MNSPRLPLTEAWTAGVKRKKVSTAPHHGRAGKKLMIREGRKTCEHSKSAVEVPKSRRKSDFASKAVPSGIGETLSTKY